MSIVLSTSGASDPIGDYESLLEALASFSSRSDLSSTFPTFVRLFEARCNRELRVMAMEATLDSTELADGAVNLPSGFRAFKELRYDGDPTYTLQPRPLEWVRNQASLADKPLYFAVTDSQVVCWPTSGSVKGTYYEEIPPLASYDTNWLLAAHPDAYLFGVLEEIALFVRDTKLGEWAGTRARIILDAIKGSDAANAISGGPLTARAR